MKQADIAIVGCGAAGIAAAVMAARSGCATLILDERSGPGGTGGFSGLTTLCGLYDENGRMLNNGFTQEFAKQVAANEPQRMGRVWVLPYFPARFRELACELLNSAGSIETLWNTHVESVEIVEGHITAINGVEIKAAIDCSGSAVVGTLAGLPCLTTDESTQAPAVVFSLGNVRRNIGSAPEAAQILLPLARAGFPPLNLTPGPETGMITVKLSGPADQVPAIVDFLRTNTAGFEDCLLQAGELVSAERAGRMIVGRYLLTSNDLLSARTFPDAIAKCAWPMEEWDFNGIVRYRYLPPGSHYEIPVGAVRASQVENLFMAGKTISADPDAIASARVMGCCLATGAAAGTMAAKWVQSQSK